MKALDIQKTDFDLAQWAYKGYGRKAEVKIEFGVGRLSKSLDDEESVMVRTPVLSRAMLIGHLDLRAHV